MLNCYQILLICIEEKFQIVWVILYFILIELKSSICITYVYIYIYTGQILNRG